MIPFSPFVPLLSVDVILTDLLESSNVEIIKLIATWKKEKMKKIFVMMSNVIEQIANITKEDSIIFPIEYTGLAVENNEEGMFLSGIVGGGFVGDPETSDSNGYASQFTLKKPFKLDNLLLDIIIFTAPQGRGLDFNFIFYKHDDSLLMPRIGDKFFGNEIIRKSVSFSPEETSTPESELINRSLIVPFNYTLNPGLYWLEFHISEHKTYELGCISNMRFEGSFVPDHSTKPLISQDLSSGFSGHRETV